jgi:hypothetical protein
VIEIRIRGLVLELLPHAFVHHAGLGAETRHALFIAEHALRARLGNSARLRI